MNTDELRRLANKATIIEVHSDTELIDIILPKDILELLDEREKMIECLKFYANPRTWTSNSGKVGITQIWTGDFQEGEHPGTCGKRARALLQSLKPKHDPDMVQTFDE